MFGVGCFAKIKTVETFDKYTICKIVTSKKDKKTGAWDTDFVDKVTFVSDAHLQKPMVDQKIKITSCGVSNSYVKDDKFEFLKRPRYVIFGYELQDSSTPTENSSFYTEIMDDGDIPF